MYHGITHVNEQVDAFSKAEDIEANVVTSHTHTLGTLRLAQCTHTYTTHVYAQLEAFSKAEDIEADVITSLGTRAVSLAQEGLLTAPQVT
jgi:hypothetical protein